jgi:hypothetical protein
MLTAMTRLQLTAICATVLVVWTGVNSLMRPPPRPERPVKKPTPTRTTERCTIKRAVFGGTEAAVIRAVKGRVVHYIVLDLPTDNPRMPDTQSNWIEANYRDGFPSVVGVFPTVEAAVDKAASLCRRN